VAVSTLHQPTDPAAYQQARRSVAFEELFLLHVGLARTLVRQDGTAHRGEGQLPTSFLAQLPFQLTDEQHKALAEIVEELAAPRRMMRLLHGEVGSGKTIVAVTAALHAIEAGYQVAFMVPTELLAEQHSAALTSLLEGLPLRVERLTGSGTDNRAVREAIRTGAVDLVVGTHALIQESVAFHRLGLVVIDEQHRFGVVQRSAIEEKGHDVDLLVMSATPIPRTLALTLYGEFDVSTIRTLPSGPRALQTVWIDSGRRDEVYRQVRRQLDQGGQGYVILPLVEASEKVDLRAATQVFEELRARFAGHTVGLVHGRLPAEQRATVMDRFRAGEIRLLVATTVIEVGIDVADANLMVIEHAERFGLSQLHQLRGRIGRCGQPASCFALASPSTDDARRRIEAFVSTDDGFALAEADLRIRGPGDLLGTKQHGFLASLRAVDLLEDLDIMDASRREARAMLADGVPPALSAEVDRRFGELLRWLQV
jgi:ATP-dependent DNA helicase RecG